MEFILLSSFLGFLTVLVATPLAEKYLSASGIYGKDQNKSDKPRIPTSGGLVVLMGFLITITFYSGLTSLFTDIYVDKELLFGALSSITLIALIGLIDDIHIESLTLSEEVDIVTGNTIIHEKAEMVFGDSNSSEDRIGLSQPVKMLMVLPAALPLIAVGAGSWVMVLPIIGEVHWGLIYPLILLPLGLLFVSNVVNMLAGTNGLSAGLSLVTAIGLGTFGFLNNQIEAAIIAFGLAASLLGFIYYNWYPASILPGDSLTYLCGAALFSSMVIGDMEKFGVFIFSLWFLEFFLKLRSRFNAHSWGKPVNGKLEPLYSRNYSLTHIFMRKGLTEKQITSVLVLIQSLIVVTGLIVFELGLL